MTNPVYQVSDFVAVFNQTVEFAYPSVTITGELTNLRISRGRWVYFDLKDEFSSLKFFGSVQVLPGPLEEGMLLEVTGAPRLHPQFGFSVNILRLRPTGEGAIKRAAALLEQKLRAEGLFDDARKRALPYPPRNIALITSGESAAYADFIKVLHHRWGGLVIQHIDVQVQGEAAIGQIVQAIERSNNLSTMAEVVVIIRGGGSADDLAVFSTEPVTRAVAASRIPTLVAIGHEIDTSLAELAADRRASTPSNAAELLAPDKTRELQRLVIQREQIAQSIVRLLESSKNELRYARTAIRQSVQRTLVQARQQLHNHNLLLDSLSPDTILSRGYSVLRSRGGKVIYSMQQVRPGEQLTARLSDGTIGVKVTEDNVQ